MTHPKRFTDAVTKLYNAFHEGTLNAFNCQACAVGSICNKSSEWYNFWFTARNLHSHGYSQNFKKFEGNVLNTGYSSIELAKVELVFLENFDSTGEDSSKDKHRQFNGLCAVIEYLCELDNIPNIMDYKSLFETENDKPKVQLETVFA